MFGKSKLNLEALEVRDCPTTWTTSWTWTSTPSLGTTAVTHTTINPGIPVSAKPVAVPVAAPVHALAAPVTPAVLEARVAAFAQSHLGQVVTASNATGCAALGVAALAAAGAAPVNFANTGPIANHYVWGKAIYQHSAVAGYGEIGALGNVRPGDIIQVDGYNESRPDGSWLEAAHHTAIVQSVDPTSGVITVLQQNWNGNQACSQGTLDPTSMNSGLITIYRPTPA